MNQMQLFEQSQNEAIITKQHSLNERKVQQLLHYQAMVCKQMEWVETDPDKVFQIVLPILKSGYVHEQNDLQILKKVILIYYHVRSSLSDATSDQTIITGIVQQYALLSGMGIETLAQRVCTALGIEE